MGAGDGGPRGRPDDAPGHQLSARPRHAAAASVAAAIALSGCSVGRPAGFVARSNDTCQQAVDGVARLKSPTDPGAALEFALDRYTFVERAVSTLSEAPLPGGAVGAEARDVWLRPARESLAAGRADLATLRTAARDDQRTLAANAFAVAAVAGSVGVDIAWLQRRGLAICAALFGAPAPPTAWATATKA